MWRGALGMIDALGFKGIWERPGVDGDAEVVLKKLRELQRTTQDAVDEITAQLPAIAQSHKIEMRQEVVFLSDTIVLGARVETLDGADRDIADWAPLLLVGTVVCKIMKAAIASTPALTYRGCIGFGEFMLDKQFIVGRAVDEVAEHMDAADAAITWAVPSAERILSRLKKDRTIDARDQEYPPLYVRSSVPLKLGRTYETWVVSPFREVGARVERGAFITAMDATFAGGGIDREIKRQHTLNFLHSENNQLRRDELRRSQRRAFKVAAEGKITPPTVALPESPKED